MIASKKEIKALAFGQNFDIEAIKDNVIQVVEWEKVLTLIGTTLYDSVIKTPGDNEALIELLKPFIAYNVKLYIIKPNALKTGNKGTMKAQGSNETSGDIEEAKRQLSTIANSYKKRIVKYLKDNNISYSETEGIINNIIIM